MPAQRGFAEAAAPWSALPSDAVIADACALIVFHGLGAAGMSPRAIAVMSGPNVHVAAITVWEIVRKAGDRRLPMLPRAGDGTFVTFLRQAGYLPIVLDWAAAARAATLPNHHRDPMDRLLIATALNAGIPIITNDRAFAPYGVATIW